MATSETYITDEVEYCNAGPTPPDVDQPKKRFPWDGLIIGLLLLTVVVVMIHRGHSQKQPELSQADMLAIRNAQVEFFRAGSEIEALRPKFQAAQAALDAAVTTGMKDAGVDPTKFQVTEEAGQLVIKPRPVQTGGGSKADGK